MAGKKVTKKKVSSGAITLNTVSFKDMVSRARKGASNNSILPLTSMMAIEVADGKLTLITTDMNNTLYVIQDGVSGDDFYVVVVADKFCQLVAKTTSENITLELKDDYLEFTGNGTYSIALPTDPATGKLVKLKDPRNEVELTPLDDVHLTDINTIVTSGKSSLAVTMEEPCLTGYYCGDEYVITTDRYNKLCKVDCGLWEEPKLVSPEMMNLLTLMTAEDIQVQANEDTLFFTSPDCQVYGKTMSVIDKYPAESVAALIDCDFLCSCKVDKGILLQLLDRLSLFVGGDDKNNINLTFTHDGLQVSSKASTGVETIQYIEYNGEEDFSCSVNIEMFVNQLKSISQNTVEIHYHNVLHTEEGDLEDNVLKFVEDDAMICVSLSIDDEE